MGDWIHCNLCIRIPSAENDQVPFYFTSCGHILCGKCYEAGPEDLCLCCKKAARALKINRSLRPDLQMFFQNPKLLLQQYVKNLNSVLDFQNGHRQRLLRARQEQQKKAMKYIMDVQLEMKRKDDLEKKALAEKDSLMREVEKLRHHAKSLEELMATRTVSLGSLGGLQTPVPASLKSKSSGASSDRSSGGSSYGRLSVATSTPITDANGYYSARGRSLSHVAAAFARAGNEPSPIACSITTPDMLGLRKREKISDEWLGTSPKPIKPYDFS